MNFCTGVRGIKFLYDGFCKELLNPEYTPERLNDFLSLLMKQKVRVHAILPNDSTRIADEISLLVTDLLLRQYKRIRGIKNKKFSYKDIKDVYTIVLYEKSPSEFHTFHHIYLHYFEQRSDSGLELPLLQKFLFVPLDIFLEIQQNKSINNKWLASVSGFHSHNICRILPYYFYQSSIKNFLKTSFF